MRCYQESRQRQTVCYKVCLSGPPSREDGIRSGLASCWAQPLRVEDALSELGAQWVFHVARAEPVFEILMHRKWARVQTDRDVRDGEFWQKETIEAVSITP